MVFSLINSHIPGDKSSVDQAFNGVVSDTYTEGTLPEIGGTWSWDFGTLFDSAGPQTVEIFYIAGGADNVSSQWSRPIWSNYQRNYRDINSY